MASNVDVDNSSPLYCFLPESEQKHPWLVMTHGKEFERQTFYSISKAYCFEKSIPELRNKLISQASYGWLLLIDNDALDCCLMNPKTMKTIHLPQVVQIDKYQCVLSRPPFDPNCHILLVGARSTLFCQVGDDKFIQVTKIDGCFMNTATNFQGKIYAWMSGERGFVTVDFEKEDLIVKNLMKKDGQQCRVPCRELNSSPMYEDHLMECCGKLLLVHMISCSSHPEQVAGFRVFQLDMVTMECEELDSIGECAIFLSEFGSMAISCSSKETGVEKDSIYYFNSELQDKLLYIYHIPYELEESLIPCPLVNDTRFLRTWIMI